MYLPGEVENLKIKQLLMTSPERKNRRTKDKFYSGLNRDYIRGLSDVLADILTGFLS